MRFYRSNDLLVTHVRALLEYYQNDNHHYSLQLKLGKNISEIIVRHLGTHLYSTVFTVSSAMHLARILADFSRPRRTADKPESS